MKSYLGWNVDFTQPPGEPALVAPDSVSWRVFKNPIALGVGGIAAVLLEFAEPRIRSGVWDHSTFKTDPIGRSKRTAMAAMVGVYGPQSAARKVIEGVNQMHARVQGETPEGETYTAMDVPLLDWVGATSAFGFLTAYDRFVSPLSYEEKCRFYQEQEPAGKLYGVETLLRVPEDFDALLETFLPRFEAHPITTEFLNLMMTRRAMETMSLRLQRAITRASVSLLPEVVRERLEIGPEYRLRTRDSLIVHAAGAFADRIPIRKSPPVQASIRLGLPPSFLFKSRRAQARILADRGIKKSPQPTREVVSDRT